MDTDLQRAKRTGDPVAELTALTRMPALRGLPPCRHCGRDLSRVDVRCESCQWHGPRRRQRDSGEPWSPWPACTACNGTGRVEWPWRGPSGRLALLAYCGDEAARLLVPFLALDRVPGIARSMQVSPLCVDQWPMDHFLGNLHRWPGALLAARVLAGRAVMGWKATLCEPMGWFGTPEHRALDAATEHHLCGCEASREAWWQADPLGGLGRPDWLVHPGELRGDPTWRIQAAIRETDEPTIRAAICAGLAGWARAGVLS